MIQKLCSAQVQAPWIANWTENGFIIKIGAF